MEEITFNLSLPDLENMTEIELLEYQHNLKKNIGNGNFVDFWIEEVTPKVQPEIRIRSSLECDLDMTYYVFSGSTSDSALVELYIQGIPGPDTSFTMGHLQKETVEIDDANTYYYKVTPLGNTTNVDQSLKAGLKHGTKSIYNITNAGPWTSGYLQFTCPGPSDGTCEVEFDITKLAGSADEYDVVFTEDGELTPVYNFQNVKPGIFGSNKKSVEIDDSKSYNITIEPFGGGSNERFSFRITTPYLAYNFGFTLDTTNPNEKIGEINGFDYFDCP